MGEQQYLSGRYAAIDIGTVTARLLVTDVDDRGSLTDLHRDHAICNLGIGVDKTGRLDPAAIERVGEVVARFVSTIDELGGRANSPAESAGEDAAHPTAGADHPAAEAQPTADAGPITVIANATSASRDAENSADFVAVLAKLGVQLQVIPGEREAALSFAGASSAFPGEKVIVLDVGGGSTEIIAGQAGGEPAHAHSFNIGCRRVTERYFHTDPPTPDQISEAAAWISEEMREYLRMLADDGFGDCRIVAVAGTATSVISMLKEMAVYDSSRVHGAQATRADIDSLLARLAAMPLADRERVVGLEPQRAPVIVAGVVILQQIMELLNAPAITVSERDILHGIVLDAAAS